MTLRDLLERAHACEPMLVAAENYVYFDDFWQSITDPEWLTWLMRHVPDKFEDSWRDVTSALHALAVAHVNADAQDYCASFPDPADEVPSRTCRLIRQYVRLRTTTPRNQP